MNKSSPITIQLQNTLWYTQPENQRQVWQQTKANVEESGLSHEKYIEAVSMMVIRTAPKVFIPLLGDIKGVQHYLITESFYLFDRRWFSYYMQANDDGTQKHAPTRLSERVRESHLANLVIDALKAHFGVNRVDELFAVLFPKHTSPLFDNVRKTTKRA